MKEKVGISAIALLLLLISCNKEDFVWNLKQIERLPSLTTEGVTDITNTGVTVRSIIENSGSADVTKRGVCWGLSQNPTVSGNKSINGSGTGSFTSTITSLNPNTTYWVRSYATNAVGTAYGNQITFSTPNITCNITATTTGTTFSMQTPSQSNFSQGDSYTITMYSSVYSFGQANNVALYDGDNSIYSFGSWLLFSNNTRTFTLPGSIPSSNCYNIRVLKGSDLYVSPAFTIVP